MMKKIVTTIALMTTIATVSVNAATVTFADMENHWAKDAVYEMANKWVVLGRPDGTFGPNENITKYHAFLMFSRLLGYYDVANKDIVKNGETKYVEQLEKDGITESKSEIAYLIEMGILDYDFAVDTLKLNGKSALTRLEASVIFVKLLGDEDKLNRFPLLLFNDTDTIADEYKSYVEYVNKIGLMVGYDNKFNPEDKVTRAQISTMLSRIDKILTERKSIQVSGLLAGIDLNQNFVEIQKENNEKIKLEINAETLVYKKEDVAKLSDLKVNDSITIYLLDNKVIKIVITNTEKVLNVNFIGSAIANDITTVEVSQNGYNSKYEMIKTAAILKNNVAIKLQEITKNEALQIRLVNNKIVEINVGVINYYESGMIEELVIGKTSYITIKKVNGEIKKYALAKNAIYDFDGAIGNIYDLRLDMDVKINVTTNGVEKVLIETYTDIEIIKGKVEQILPKIFVFTMKLSDGNIMMIFLDEEETIIKTDEGVLKLMADINVNDNVSVYGRFEGEVFYPLQVIIH